MNKLVKTVDRKDLYKEFLNSLNGILQLTNREQDLVIVLLELQINSTKLPGYKGNLISAENRKYIRSVTGITNDNLSRYLNKFKSKGIIIKGKADDDWMMNPAVIPEIIGDRVQITLVLNLNK